MHAMPQSPMNPMLREARAAVFAAVCVLVGAAGHDALSPAGIPAWALVVSTAILYVAVRPLTKRERGLPGIVGAMGVVQLALHAAFSSAQQHAPTTMPDMQMAAAARAHGLPPVGAWWCGPKAPAGMTGMVMHHAAGMPSAAGHSMTVGMFGWHIAAALVASWWLWRGEAAAWDLGRALVLLVAEPLRLLGRAFMALAALTRLAAWTPPRVASPRAFDATHRLGPGRLVRFSLARRGPPVATAFC